MPGSTALSIGVCISGLEAANGGIILDSDCRQIGDLRLVVVFLVGIRYGGIAQFQKIPSVEENPAGARIHATGAPTAERLVCTLVW